MADVMSPSSDVAVDNTMTTTFQKKWLMAMIEGDQQVMTQLLKENPDLASWKNYIDGTALHYAAMRGDNGLIGLLIGTYKANVNEQNSGLTPLHFAVMRANRETAFLLLSTYKADRNIRDYSGRHPRDYIPNTKAGETLKNHFPDPLITLINDRSNYIYFIANNWLKERFSAHPPRSCSATRYGDLKNCPNPIDPHTLPIHSHFPWQQKAQSPISDDMRSRLFPWLPSDNSHSASGSSVEDIRKLSVQPSTLHFDSIRQSKNRSGPRYQSKRFSKISPSQSDNISNYFDGNPDKHSPINNRMQSKPDSITPT